VSFPNLIFNAVSLGDLDGNGGLDLLVQVGRWPPAGSITVLCADGRALGAGWAPQELGGLPWARPRWPISTETVGSRSCTSPRRTSPCAPPLDRSPRVPGQGGERRAYSAGVAIADLSSASPGLELVAADTASGSPGGSVRLVAVTAAGKPLPGFPLLLASDASGVGIPRSATWTATARLEIALVVRGKGIVVVSPEGKLLGNPIQTLADATASVQLLDLDGDGALELLADNNTADADGKGYSRPTARTARPRPASRSGLPDRR